MAEIITDGSQKELKKHGSDEFPLLVFPDMKPDLFCGTGILR